jgi:hypothetical protein
MGTGVTSRRKAVSDVSELSNLDKEAARMNCALMMSYGPYTREGYEDNSYCWINLRGADIVAKERLAEALEKGYEYRPFSLEE